jgi:hypothetical protein
VAHHRLTARSSGGSRRRIAHARAQLAALVAAVRLPQRVPWRLRRKDSRGAGLPRKMRGARGLYRLGRAETACRVRVAHVERCIQNKGKIDPLMRTD